MPQKRLKSAELGCRLRLIFFQACAGDKELDKPRDVSLCHLKEITATHFCGSLKLSLDALGRIICWLFN